MKLAVSNIAWDPDEDGAVVDLLCRRGVRGIEVAPTKLWPSWHGASPAAARAVRAAFDRQGLAIPAVQAILFGRPELQVFGGRTIQSRLLDHIEDVAALAEDLGARVLVFGSPRNRDPGELSSEQALQEAVDFFRRAGERCHPRGVCLCIESNPRAYACRFMVHWHEVLDLVDRVDQEGIGIHLDTACIALEGDDVVQAIRTCAGRIAHFHVSEPELRDFATPETDHATIGRALRASGYDGWLSIEMRRSERPLDSIDQAVARVAQWYG